MISTTTGRIGGPRGQTGLEIPGELLAHVSPLGWEHINLTGEYRWPGADRRAPRNPTSPWKSRQIRIDLSGGVS